MRTKMHAGLRMRRVATLVSVAAIACTALVATPGVAAAVSLPTVSNVSPNRGPDAGGTTVTVTGTNLTGATAVYFGAVAGDVDRGRVRDLVDRHVAGADLSNRRHHRRHTWWHVTDERCRRLHLREGVVHRLVHERDDGRADVPAGRNRRDQRRLSDCRIVDDTNTDARLLRRRAETLPGNGVLRLTSNAGNLEGSAFYSTSLPTANGLDLTFNTYQYGSSSEADGIAFSLGATDPSNPSAPVNMGPAGGHLGYSGRNRGPTRRRPRPRLHGLRS